MTIALRGSIVSASAAGTSETLSITPVVGSLLVVTVSGYWALGGESAYTISDGVNAWHLADAESDGSQYRTEIWYAMDVAAGATTVTVATSNSPSSQQYSVGEFTGVATTAALDTHAGGTAAATTTPTTSSIAQAVGNELFIGSVACASGAALSSVNTSGWAHFGVLSTAPGNGAYNITTDALSHSCVFTEAGGSSDAYVQAVANFKASVTNTNAPAGLATETSAALDATTSVQPNAGAAAQSSAALAPTANVQPGAGVSAAETSAALTPSTSVAPHAGLAAESSAALNPVSSVAPNASVAAGTWGALDATASTVSGDMAPAGLASAAMGALDAKVNISTHAGVATGTWVSPSATAVTAVVGTAVIPVLNPFQMVEVGTQAASDTGTMKLYFKSDETLYSMDSAGTEKAIGGGVTVPLDVPHGSVFKVPANTQALFRVPITVEGHIQIDGILVGVL